MRGQPNLNQSITGIKTASELKPALQVKQSSRLIGKGSFRAGSGLRNKLPPVKATSKTGLDVEHSPDKSASMIQEPYGYEEYKYSTASMVPSKFTVFMRVVTDKAKSTIFSCPLEWKKRKVEITKIRAGEEDFEEDDFERAGTGPMGARAGRAEAQDLTDLKQVQSAVNNKEWVDLDKYIELLLDSKSEDEIVFIYWNPNKNGDPYDLQVCSYDERNEEKYYTMSGKGLSWHEGDHVTEFISLAQWLINRDSYNHIKELRFFK